MDSPEVEGSPPSDITVFESPYEANQRQRAIDKFRTWMAFGIGSGAFTPITALYSLGKKIVEDKTNHADTLHQSQNVIINFPSAFLQTTNSTEQVYETWHLCSAMQSFLDLHGLSSLVQVPITLFVASKATTNYRCMQNRSNWTRKPCTNIVHGLRNGVLRIRKERHNYCSLIDCLALMLTITQKTTGFGTRS